MNGSLAADEKAKILEIASRHPRKSAACIEALKIAQAHHRWISEERLNDVARLLHMTEEELQSIASFYSLIYRKPVGRHVIHLCDSISCWVTGYRELARCLKEKLQIDFGGTTADGRFTLLPICCLGACDKAPCLMIDDETLTNVNRESLDEVLNSYE